MQSCIREQENASMAIEQLNVNNGSKFFVDVKLKILMLLT